MVSHKHVARLGKAVRSISRLRGGSGSALPGLVVEKMSPSFLSDILGKLPRGVVVVTGTNGKTTTTKFVTHLLRSAGLTVFTNPSGSNFTRGIVSSILPHLNADGQLGADIAVLELDEAYAVRFARDLAPQYSLILNVFRDQLDRFGEVDHTARLLGDVVSMTTKGVVLNRDDKPVRELERLVASKADLSFFGYDASLANFFPSDADIHNATASVASNDSPNGVVVSSFKGRTAEFAVDGTTLSPTTLKVDGIYNVLNVAAALSLVRLVLGDSADMPALLTAASDVKPAFGRGEAVTIDGQPLEIVLVKNPSGFRLALTSYSRRPAATMIAINDNYADGRDMSWLWDVGFASLKRIGVDTVSGMRAYDMALRLQYEEVAVGHVETDIRKALEHFLANSSGSRRIYCSYTAMLALRKALSKAYKVEPIE